MSAFRAHPDVAAVRVKLPLFAAQALYLVLVSSIFYIFRSNWAYDDPFITYRYAHNIAQGAGFVYNPSERVLSTTTPLFTLLLALIDPLWSNLPQAAVIIGSICLAWGGLSLWRLGQAWKVPPVSWAGSGLYPGFSLLLDTLGSEMPLYLALCLAAAAAYAQKRYSSCAIFSAFAVLTRPDGILLALVLSIDFIARQRSFQTIIRQLSRPALLFTALTLPWFIFAWFYFGSPIPATLATKQHQASMEISTGFAAGFVNLARKTISSGPLIRRGIILLEALLAVIGIPAAFVKYKRHDILQQAASLPPWLPILAWPVVFFLAYSALQVSGYFWYYAPLVPGFLIACGFGIFALQHFLSVLASRSNRQGNLEKVTDQPQTLPASTPPALPLISILLCTGLALCQIQVLQSESRRSDPRFLIYQAVGNWLHDYTSSEARVGALEVGIIGYYAGRPMVDFAGLLQPEVALQLKPGNTYQDAAVWAIENYRPEFVVLHRDIFPPVEQLLTRRCIRVEQFSGASYNYSGNLDIYHCPNP